MLCISSWVGTRLVTVRKSGVVDLGEVGLLHEHAAQNAALS